MRETRKLTLIYHLYNLQGAHRHLIYSDKPETWIRCPYITD